MYKSLKLFDRNCIQKKLKKKRRRKEKNEIEVQSNAFAKLTPLGVTFCNSKIHATFKSGVERMATSVHEW